MSINRLQSILLLGTTTTHRRLLPHHSSISRAWFYSGRSFRNQTHMETDASCDAAVVGDSGLLLKKIDAIRNAGPAKLQVIADFDATLTRYRVNGCRGQSSHGLLQQEDPEYDRKRRELYEHYHPLEFSPTIPLEEKTKLMEEWKRDIPILIFSAGLADIIEEVLRQKVHRLFKNVKIVSNRMVFDDNGRLVSFRGKTIHSLNKNEHALDMAGPLHDRLGDVDGPPYEIASVKTRLNVLLLGDHIGDLGMSDGLNFENRISVGFLNDNVENSLDCYRNAFDVVYLNDAPMWGVVKLVSQLCPVGGD